MNILKERKGNVTVLRVRGTIKLGESARRFAELLDQILHHEAGPVLIDFSEIDYVDSTGIGELVGYLQKFESARRPLALLRPRERIAALLRATRLDTLFKIHDSEEQALEALAAQGAEEDTQDE